VTPKTATLKTATAPPVARPPLTRPSTTAIGILSTLSFCHLLNDMMQSLLPAIYPILKSAFALDFGQVGLITLTNQLTASLLQPVVGLYTDRKPKPYSLAIGMGFTLAGLVLLSTAAHYYTVIGSAALIGLGSSIFHPESSRIARLASGGRHGFAQSLFQVGGNAGSSFGPLLAAFVVLPRGQSSIAWFSIAAIVAIAFLWRVGNWYKQSIVATAGRVRGASLYHESMSPRQAKVALSILLALIFSKYVYLSSLTSYYTFYLISRFHLSVQSAQIHLFLFLGAVAAGTIIGGPVGDRIGRRHVILWSILGVLPFTLALPYADLFWTRILTMIIGVVLASAFSAIVVYAQELVPGRVGMIAGLFFGIAFGTAGVAAAVLGRVGMIAGLFFGIAFGTAGVAAAVLGRVADLTDIFFVYRICAFLPAIGILAFWLPRIEHVD
jgi:FSR family fosmidomycin resistance protein-like MFS transporter